MDCETSQVPTPMAPFLPSIRRTGRDTTSSRLLATWTSLNPTLQVRPLRKRGTITLAQASYSLWNGTQSMAWFCHLPWGKRLRQTNGGLLLSLCSDHFIQPYRQAPLRGTTSFRQWRKGNCEAQTSQCCLEADLKIYAKSQAEFSTHFDTALSRMSSTLMSNSHTFDIGINPTSESGREEIVSARETLRWEVSCSLLRVAWAEATMPVQNSDRLWSAFLLARVNVMLSGGVEDQNPKAAGWLEK